MNEIHERILENLKELCNKYPNQRFGQILFNYTMIGMRDNIGTVRDPFYYDDEDFLDNMGD